MDDEKELFDKDMFYNQSKITIGMESDDEVFKKTDFVKKSCLLSNEDIFELRDFLKRKLKNYNGEPINLEMFDMLDSIVFRSSFVFGKKFALDIETLRKLDLSSLSFDNFICEGVDFTGLNGVKINPQTIHNKSLRDATVSGVTFIGSFDNVDVIRTNFKGSRGAVIEPTKVVWKDLSDTILEDVTFVGPFDGAKISGDVSVISEIEAFCDEKTDEEESVLESIRNILEEICNYHDEDISEKLKLLNDKHRELLYYKRLNNEQISANQYKSEVLGCVTFSEVSRLPVEIIHEVQEFLENDMSYLTDNELNIKKKV